MEKRDYLLIGLIIVVGFVVLNYFPALTGFAVFGSGPELLFEIRSQEANLDELKTQISANVGVVEDSLIGNVFSFNGNEQFMRTRILHGEVEEGFSAIILAYVDDNRDKNHIGLISTGEQRADIGGFRLKYRDFEDFDRVYTHLGEGWEYGVIPDGSCYQQWCYYAFTYDSDGTTKIFVNGDKIHEYQAMENIVFDDHVNIGRTIDVNGEFLTGKVAHVAVYQGVVSESDVKEISQIPE